MGLMYSLAEHQQQCQRSLCLHLGSKLLLSCFYWASLWSWQFLWGDHKLDVSAPSFLCVWSQMIWRSLQIRVLPQGFLHELLRFNYHDSHSNSCWVVVTYKHKNFSNIFISLFLFISSSFFLFFIPFFFFLFLFFSSFLKNISTIFCFFHLLIRCIS